MNLSALREHCRSELASEAFYERMWMRGYHFGPTFRSIGSIWRGDGEVLCQVSAANGDPQQSRVQLIDCCLQLPAAIFHANDLETIYLPVGFDQLRFTEPIGGPIWGYAALRPGADRGEGAVFDIFLLEETGQVIAALTGLQSKRANREIQAIASGSHVEPDTYEVCWRPAPRQGEQQPAGDQAGAWLILADQRGTGAALAGLLHARGERCIMVLPGALSELDEEGVRWVDPTRPDEVARLLHDEIVANSPLRGVVHCWSLDVEPHASLNTIQTLVCDSVLSALQALDKADTAQAPRLWLVTRGVHAVAPDDLAAAVGQAPLWGFGRTIAYEHPELRCTLIDLDSKDMDVQDLCNELCSDSQDDQVGLRNGERYAAHLALATAFTAAPNIRFDVTYLITGGLGGLGLKVADWLVAQGTRHLALLGRSAPTEAAAQTVETLRARGAQVLLLQADVSDTDQLAAALDQVRQELPPLGGVVHAAGVLDDGLMLQLTPERLRRVLAPKVAGAWNLHALTRTDPIDSFILFSSASGLLGAPGQANYAAANAFLDALAHYRRADGLPALSINWGPWAEVGLAAAQSNRGQRLATRGVASMSTEAGLRALGRALGQDRPQVGILSFDLRQWQRYYPQAAGLSFLSELAPFKVDQAPEQDIRVQLLALPPGRQRRLLLEELLVERMCQVLRLDANQLDRRKPLGDFGFDSLMALELRNVLEASLGVQLSATLIWRYPSIGALTDHMAEKLGIALDAPKTPEPEHRDDLERVAIQIADLSDAEMETLLLQQIDRMTGNQ
jgi:myxalamid-type polyketide synthase MxaE and MxaD